MNVDINGFAHELFGYTRSRHENTSIETMKANLQTIFDKFGVNDSNFTIISLALGEAQVKNVSSYINKYATKVFEKEQRRKEMREKLEQNAEDKNDKDKQRPKTKKRPICFNVTEIGELPPEAIAGHMARKMRLAGYTPEEIQMPLEQLNVIGLDDKMMDLNITPGVPALEQFVELTKKLYMVLVNGEKASEVRNLSITNLMAYAKEEEAEVCHTINGTHVHGSEDTIEADVEVSMNADGSRALDADIEDPLTEEDIREINEYGIENITSHSEMEDFRDSEEYELIQNMQSMALRNDNIDE